MFLRALILYCIEQFYGERSVNAIYYLLKGKKSSQTIQDAAWFSLRKFFQSYPDLELNNYLMIIQEFKKEQLIIVHGKSVLITDRGRKYYQNYFKKYPIPSHFNGWIYQQTDRQFWQRLSLAVQTISHWAYGETRFLPVQRNLLIQQDVKRWLYILSKQYDKQTMINKFYQELTNLFQTLEEKEADPTGLTYRLSGYQVVGLTEDQIADALKMDRSYFYILFRSTLQLMLATIWRTREYFPFLAQLIGDLRRPLVLTKSTEFTYQLLQRGKTIDDISRIRRLKRSTVEDHIVEIVLMEPRFSIDPYVSQTLQKKIVSAIQKTKSRRLKVIKDRVPEADYFAIRLVLSKWQEPSE